MSHHSGYCRPSACSLAPCASATKGTMQADTELLKPLHLSPPTRAQASWCKPSTMGRTKDRPSHRHEYGEKFPRRQALR